MSIICFGLITIIVIFFVSLSNDFSRDSGYNGKRRNIFCNNCS